MFMHVHVLISVRKISHSSIESVPPSFERYTCLHSPALFVPELITAARMGISYEPPWNPLCGVGVHLQKH